MGSCDEFSVDLTLCSSLRILDQIERDCKWQKPNSINRQLHFGSPNDLINCLQMCQLRQVSPELEHFICQKPVKLNLGSPETTLGNEGKCNGLAAPADTFLFYTLQIVVAKTREDIPRRYFTLSWIMTRGSPFGVTFSAPCSICVRLNSNKSLLILVTRLIIDPRNQAVCNTSTGQTLKTLY